MLTHWLPMTSILFVIGRFYSNQFKCNYLRNRIAFSQFFTAFLKIRSVLNIFFKKMTFILHVFPKLRTAKYTCLDKCSKSPISKHPSRVNVLRQPKHCWNLHDSTFLIFFNHSDRCSVRSVSVNDMWIITTVCEITEYQWQVFFLS